MACPISQVGHNQAYDMYSHCVVSAVSVDQHSSAILTSCLETTTDNRKQQYSCSNRVYLQRQQDVAISGCRSLSQSSGALSLNSSQWKTQDFPLEFRRYLQYISFRDTSTSGFGGHIAISGCRLMPKLFGNTFLSSLWSESYTLSVQLQQYLFWI